MNAAARWLFFFNSSEPPAPHGAMDSDVPEMVGVGSVRPFLDQNFTIGRGPSRRKVRIVGRGSMAVPVPLMLGSGRVQRPSRMAVENPFMIGTASVRPPVQFVENWDGWSEEEDMLFILELTK